MLFYLKKEEEKICLATPGSDWHFEHNRQFPETCISSSSCFTLLTFSGYNRSWTLFLLTYKVVIGYSWRFILGKCILLTVVCNTFITLAYYNPIKFGVNRVGFGSLLLWNRCCMKSTYLPKVEVFFSIAHENTTWQRLLIWSIYLN